MAIRSRLPLACAAALATSLALLASPLRGHIDDTDAQLYQVVVRGMMERRSWLEPGLPPGSLDPFREHLPFAFWPFILAARACGEAALPWISASFSLATVALVLHLGLRLGGARAGICAALLLGVNETFFLYGARPRLDPLLVLAATCAAAPFLLGDGPLRRGRVPSLLGAAAAVLAGAVGVLVKGPFGLVPLAAAGCARGIIDASAVHEREGISPAGPLVALARTLAWTGAALLVAALPAATFLLRDRSLGGPWWEGYVGAQLTASALGLRRDGATAFSYPLATVAGRFWPGLPFVLLGMLQALGLPLPETLRPSARTRVPVRLLALASALSLAALGLPTRKWWNHELVVWPLLALLGGVALAPSLERLSARTAAVALVAMSFAVILLGLVGAPVRLLPAPCVGSREFASALSTLAPGDPVLVVSPTPDWRMLVTLAAERRLSPWPLSALPAEPALGGQGPREEERLRSLLALAELGAGAQPPRPWRVLVRAREWALLSR